MDNGRPSQKAARSNPDSRFHYPHSQPQASRLPRPANGTNAARENNQFPPHPSVRLPANVRSAGVGMGTRPGNPAVNAPRPQMAPPPGRSQNNGQMVQNYKFPQVPPPIPTSAQPLRSRESAPRNKYNMHDSYVSSIYEDSTPSRNTPSSKSPGRGAFPIRDSASVYPETEAPDSPQAAYPSSRVIPQQSFPPSPIQEVNSAYPSSRFTPHVNTDDLNPPPRLRAGEISPASSRTTAMNALSAAIAAGFSGTPKPKSPQTPPGRTFSPMRMPFQQGSASRPRSVDEISQEEDIAPPELIDAPNSKTPMLTPGSAKSETSTNPLLGLGINKPGMSSKVPAIKRPPRLDIDAVRDMEARGSTTSLTDLIRRATKLASNLDRGKTASRLGMLDFGGSKEKLGQFAPGNRDSTMSDMLSSFPAPAATGTPRRDTMWPLAEQDENEKDTTNGTRKKRRRRCCGMSLPVAIVVLIVLVILVAAAVLIPIFLILVPKQQKDVVQTVSQCAETQPCANGGSSVLANNACQCVCSSGFSGPSCNLPQTAQTTDCTVKTVNDGSTTFEDATMGTIIAPLFTDAQDRFGITLNATLILSAFSSNSLKCSDENRLVNFNSTSSTSSSKRFIIVPGLNDGYDPQLIHVPTHITAALVTPTPTLLRRDEPTVGSTNGIVFQTSQVAESSVGAASTVYTISATSAPSSSATATATSSSSPSSTSAPLATDKHVIFAQVAVLFALEQSYSVSFATNAQQSMSLFFSGSTGNSTVLIGTDALPLAVNFKAFEITLGNGTVLGGKSG